MNLLPRDNAAGAFFQVIGPVRKILPGGDIGLALCVLMQLAILIFPVPPVLLDIALALSFTLAVLILLTSVLLEKPLDFSSLPTLLLLTTMMRIALNVATARLILAHGSESPNAAGHVVAALGGLVMGGDLVVGVIIFLMLLMVNFVVISKGSSRIAEVSARFYLDSMPGKQMAIDADLSSGVIDEPTARIRRALLAEESGFYGAMDGACRFVRGDAVCALVITFVNIICGLGIGVIGAHMPIETAIGRFTTLTVGDGLVSQIPARLVSSAAGITVSKGAIEGQMHGKLALQLGSSANALLIASAATGIVAMLPGLPTTPFLLVSLLTGSLGWQRGRKKPVAEPVVIPEPSVNAVVHRLVPDSVRVELGFGLLDLATGDGERLPERVKRLRRSLVSELGFVLPSVRIQDNVSLGPYGYCFALKEITAGMGELRPMMMLAVGSGAQAEGLQGEPTTEPTFGLPAYWIAPEMADAARLSNWTVVDPLTVITTHLYEVVKENMAELLSYAEFQKILSGMPPEEEKLMGELVPSVITAGGLQRVLQMLLAERVSIRDFLTILEGVQEACANGARSTSAITAHVRSRLSRQISEGLVGPGGYLAALVLSAAWEETLVNSLAGQNDERQVVLDPNVLRDFLDRVRSLVDGAVQSGERPVLLTATQLRLPIHLLLDRVTINVPVIAQNEIHRRVRIRVVGSV